jgi:hypothetical protein
MNSLTQQFAALAGFAEGLLAAPVPDSVLLADAADADAKAARDAAALLLGGGGDGGAAAAAAAAEGGTWQCGVCTFECDAAAAECDVCGSAKPANAKITVPGVDADAARKEKEAAAKAQKVKRIIYLLFACGLGLGPS